jgi:hypothetical protein
MVYISALTIFRLDAEPIFNDEYHSVRHTGILKNAYDIPQIIDSVATTSPQHVPLYFILLSGWISLTGNHPITMRLLSVFPMLLTVALSFRFGKAIIDEMYGRWISFFIATSGFSIFFASQIRMYTFLLLFCVWLIWSYWRVAVALPRKKINYFDWFGLWLSSVLLIYTHYIGIIALLAIGTYHLIQFRWQKKWFSVVAVELLAGSMFLFWLNIFISGLTNRNDLSATVLSFIEATYHTLNVSSNGVFVAGLVLIGLAISNFRSGNNDSRFIIWIGLVSWISLPIANEFAPILPVNRMRYAIIIIPFMSLLFAWGVRAVGHLKWINRLIGLGWIVASLMFSQHPLLDVYNNHASKQFGEYPPYHIFARILIDLPGFDEPLITLSPDVDVMLNIRIFYSEWLGRELNHIWDEPDETLAPLVDLRLDIIQDELSILVAYESDVVLEDVPSFQNIIAKDFKNCGTVYEVDSTLVDYFVRDIIPCDLIDDAIPMASYRDGIYLENIEIVEQDSNYYRIYSWWVRSAVENAQLGFWISVVDADGVEVIKTTNTMPPKSIGFNDIDLGELPNGLYQIELMVFNLVDGTPLAQYNEGNNHTRIGEIDVIAE